MQYVTTCRHEFFQLSYELYSVYFNFSFDAFLLISSYGKCLLSFCYVIIYCACAGITTFRRIGPVPFSVERWKKRGP